MSQTPRQLIAENKRTKAKSLDLGNCGLTDLEKEVPELFECVWLEELILSNGYYDNDSGIYYLSYNNGVKNTFTDIPKKIKNIRYLKSLHLGSFTVKSKELIVYSFRKLLGLS